MRRSKKVYYDLTESTEYVELLNCRFYFSSSFNKERFLSGYESYIKEEEDKIIAKYNVLISIRFYLLIAFYMKIEKRGFYVVKDKNNIINKNTIIFTELNFNELGV